VNGIKAPRKNLRGRENASGRSRNINGIAYARPYKATIEQRKAGPGESWGFVKL
jgi:hypothetical protein